MGVWFTKVKGFRNAISNNDDSIKTGKRLHKICNMKKYKQAFNGFNTKRLLNKNTDDGLDRVLEDLYDYCDFRRIWIEF